MAVLKRSRSPAAGRDWKNWLRHWLILGLLWLPGDWNLRASPTTSKEYQVKAVFLFNFAQFVSWPTNAFSGPGAPLVIGVLGDDPFGDYLDQMVQGEKAHERPLLVERYHGVDEIKTCHVLFVSRSESTRLEPVLASLQGRSILTVGDTDTFTGRGGMIQFLMEKNKLRLRINLPAAKASHLTISSKLLRPAEIVAAGNG